MAIYFLPASELGTYGNWASPDPDPLDDVEREVEEWKREKSAQLKSLEDGDGSLKMKAPMRLSNGLNMDQGLNLEKGLNLGKFFRLAKAECANYQDTGPRKLKHYCCLEPGCLEPGGNDEPGDRHQCSLHHRCSLFLGKRCKWFEEAVLPTDTNLFAEWMKMVPVMMVQVATIPTAGRNATTETGSTVKQDQPRTAFKKCKCGNLFQPGSNRQRFCPECSLENRKNQTKKRVRASRAKKR